METNFFTQIHDLKLSGNIRLNIQPQPDGTMTVSLLLIDDSLKDKTANQIPPLILKGSIEELNSNFFATITTPVRKTSELLCNRKEHELALKNAQTSSSSKTNSGSGSKEKDAKQKRFEEQMKKVNDLEKLNKIGEAIGQMPDAKTYPEFEDEIKVKMQQLRGKHGTLSLFGETMDETKENPNTDSYEPGHEDDSEEDDPEENNPETELDPEDDDEYNPNR